MKPGIQPYTEVRGDSRVFGYVNEDGERIPVRNRHIDMTSVELKNQLQHIEHEFCEEAGANKEGSHRFKLASGETKEFHAMSLKKAKEKAGKGAQHVKSSHTMSGEIDETAGGLAPSKKNDAKYNAWLVKQKKNRETNKQMLKEGYEPSLENAVHSYKLPPFHGEDHPVDHFKHVEKTDSHFKKHLELHGYSNPFTTQERKVLLAHRHLSENGHIAASKEAIAHGDKSGTTNHACEQLTNALYLHDHPEPKIARVFMHKALKKIRDNHEERNGAIAGPNIGLGLAQAQPRIYEGKVLNELSKGTLKRYVKAAAGSTRDLGHKAGEQLRDPDPHVYGQYAKNYRKTNRRIRGIVRATNKLANEGKE